MHMGDLAYQYLTYETQGDPAPQFSDWFGHPSTIDNTWSMDNPPLAHVVEQSIPDLVMPSTPYVAKPPKSLGSFERILTVVPRVTSHELLHHHPPKHLPWSINNRNRPRTNRAVPKQSHSRMLKESGLAMLAGRPSVGTTNVTDTSRMQESERYVLLAIVISVQGTTPCRGITISIARERTSEETPGTISGSRTHLFICEGFPCDFLLVTKTRSAVKRGDACTVVH